MEFYYDEIQKDVLVIKADGGLSSETADQFVKDLEKLIDAGLKKIVVDCSSLDYVSSFGLGLLIRINTKMRKLGGDVKMCSIENPILRILQLTRLDSFFEIYPDANRALLAFRPPDKAPD